MAVSKIAIIALVVIVACPILLGYALNLSEVTETDYKMKDDTLNVTPILQDGYDYSYAAADIYDLNTRFKQAGSPAEPSYLKYTTARTAIPMSVSYSPGGPHTLADFSYLYYVQDYDQSNGYNTLTLTLDDNTTTSVIGFHSVYWNGEALYITKYNYSGGVWSDATLFGIFTNVTAINYDKPTGVSGHEVLYYYWNNSPPTTYVDISGGFKLNMYDNALATGYTEADLPWWTNNLLVSVDLNSISASSYSFKIKTGDAYNQIYYMLEKTTVSSVVHWKVKMSNSLNGTYDELTELYYDQSKSSNTYQIQFNKEGTVFNYVGAWPTVIGPANTYWKYEYDYGSTLIETYFGVYGQTPKMRMDAADYRAFQYPVIENETYTPSQFRTNPATTISNPTVYGTSITFGGNTYTVSDGKITLGSHQVPVKDLVLSSVAVDGNYENRIGNTVISTTATPSTITFNGKWSADITTVSMEEYSYTKTEWHAGSFAWDGMDHNFLIVGMITCLGVFVALGIYARKSRSGGIIPLMIVTGCAAAVFFIML